MCFETFNVLNVPIVYPTKYNHDIKAVKKFRYVIYLSLFLLINNSYAFLIAREITLAFKYNFNFLWN